MYVRSAIDKPWHIVDRGQTLCNAPTTGDRVRWAKELGYGERLCLNCKNLKLKGFMEWQNKTKVYDEEKGRESLESWKAKVRGEA